VVIFAKERAVLGRSVRHLSGQIVVNDPGGVAVVSQLFGAIEPTQLVADTVKVRPFPTKLPGPGIYELFANALVDPKGTAVIDNGPLPVTLPLLTFPTPTSATAGTGDVVVPRETALTLPPGAYRDIVVGTHGTLFFTGGDYSVRQIRARARAALLFNGPAMLSVAQRAGFGRQTVFAPSFSALNGRCVELNYAGTSTVRFGQLSSVAAIVRAPGAKALSLGLGGEYTGHFVARKVIARRSSTLASLPALTSPCQ